MGRVTDIDLDMYRYEEAAALRRAGWTVEPPEGIRWQFSRCIGWDNRGCMVRTPRLRCSYCNRSLRKAA